MTDLQKARENYEHFCYARDHGHLDFIAKAELCDNYFLGQQWDSAVVAKLNRLGKPILTINKILSTCATVFGEQLQNRADVSFRPSRGGTPEVAQVLDKLWLHISHTQNLDWIESEVAADGFIRGRGFFDVRIGFDDQMRGEVRIKQLNSKNVVVDPDAETYDPDEWKEVFVTKWVTINDVESLFGKSCASEIQKRPDIAFNTSYDSVDWLPDNFGGKERPWTNQAVDSSNQRRIYRVIERQYKELKYTEWFVSLDTGDMREVPDIWEPERIQQVMQQHNLTIIKRKSERIRWVVSLDDYLLHNEISPYKHFTPVPYFPYFRHGETIGIVENLISPQDLLNKAISQELHIVNTTANSGWIVKSGSLANMSLEELQERSGEDGLILASHTTPSDIVKIQPNQVPSGVDRLSFKADESLKEVSMVSDSMRGFDRSDVAAKAIQAKQVRGSISMSKPFDNLAFTRKLLARNVLDLVQTFYDEARVINVTGRNLTDQAEQVEVNQVSPEGEVINDLTIGEYSVVVTTVPMRQDYEQSQFGEALEMRQLGIAIPDDILIEHSHLGRKGEIAQRLKAMNGGGEPSQQQQQLQQLDMQLKQMEAEEKKADIQVKMSNAQLNAARAQKEATEQQGGDNSQAELLKIAMEREKAMVQTAMDKEKMKQEIMLKKAELEAEIKLKWAELQAEQKIQQQKLNADLQMQRQNMQFEGEKLGMQRETNQMKMQADIEKTNLQRETTQQKSQADREQALLEMQLKREGAEQDRDLQWEESEQNRQLQRETAEQDRQMQRDSMQHEHKMSERELSHKEKMGAGELKVKEKAIAQKPKSGAK